MSYRERKAQSDCRGVHAQVIFQFSIKRGQVAEAVTVDCVLMLETLGLRHTNTFIQVDQSKYIDSNRFEIDGSEWNS